MTTNWDVACPKCGTVEQQPCGYRGGRPWFHKARKDAAAAANRRAAVDNDPPF